MRMENKKEKSKNYMAELDAWFEEELEVCARTKVFDPLIRGIRVKILESYRNGIARGKREAAKLTRASSAERKAVETD